MRLEPRQVTNGIGSKEESADRARSSPDVSHGPPHQHRVTKTHGIRYGSHPDSEERLGLNVRFYRYATARDKEHEARKGKWEHSHTSTFEEGLASSRI